MGYLQTSHMVKHIATLNIKSILSYPWGKQLKSNCITFWSSWTGWLKQAADFKTVHFICQVARAHQNKKKHNPNLSNRHSVKRFEHTSLAASSCESDNAMASCNSSSSSSRISCSDFLAGTYKQVRVQHVMTLLAYQIGYLQTFTLFRDFIRSQRLSKWPSYELLLTVCKLPVMRLSFTFSNMYAQHNFFLFA